MKKLLLCFILVLTLCVCLGSTAMVVKAEEPSTNEITTIIDGEQKEEITNAVLEAIKPYISEYDNEYVKYFTEKVLPALIGAVVTLILGVCMLAPYIKKVKENNQLKGILHELQKVNADKEATATAEQTARDNFLSAFKGETDKLSLDMNLFSKIATNEKENTALLEQIKNFLLVIGAENSEAVSTLSMTASEQVVKDDEKKIVQLENVIRQLSGENAEELIKKAEQI